jgi:hypothetical protein
MSYESGFYNPGDWSDQWGHFKPEACAGRGGAPTLAVGMDSMPGIAHAYDFGAGEEPREPRYLYAQDFICSDKLGFSHPNAISSSSVSVSLTGPNDTSTMPMSVPHTQEAAPPSAEDLVSLDRLLSQGQPAAGVPPPQQKITILGLARAGLL